MALTGPQRFYTAAGMGTAGGFWALLLRLWLVKTGMDSQGLLDPAHPGILLSLLLGGIALAFFLWLTVKEPSGAPAFHTCNAGAFSRLIGALGMAVMAVQILQQAQLPLLILVGALGVAAALCSGLLAMLGLLGREENGLLSLVPVAFSCLLPIYFYQLWCRQSQIDAYLFQLIGCLCAMLWSWHRAAGIYGMGSRKLLVLLTGMGSFACLAAAPGSCCPVYFLCMAIHIAMDSMALAPEREDPDVPA